MTVKHILAEKGGEVFTLAPSAPVMDALKTMADHNVGALVVATPDKVIKGILSERDVVRGLGRTGRDILDKTVADLMTAKVRTCTEEATVPELMELMTKGRFRHLPVERDGKLVGIISIGDVVKRRIEEIEREAEDIRSYITSD
jgi:CBS domain-containing protein